MHNNEIRMHLRRLVALSEEAEATLSLRKLWKIRRETDSILRTLHHGAPKVALIIKGKVSRR